MCTLSLDSLASFTQEYKLFTWLIDTIVPENTLTNSVVKAVAYLLFGGRVRVAMGPWVPIYINYVFGRLGNQKKRKSAISQEIQIRKEVATEYGARSRRT